MDILSRLPGNVLDYRRRVGFLMHKHMIDHGVEVRGIYDGVLYWVCECGHAFPRYHANARRDAASVEFAERYNNVQT